MGEKLDFISVKKRNLNMLLKSTKQCPGYFTSLLHLTEKKKKKPMGKVLSTFPFYRGGN